MYQKIVIPFLITLFSSNVFAACQVVQNPDVSFNCRPSQANMCSSTSTLTLFCSGSQTINAILSTGQSGSFAPRSMRSEKGDILQYNVYLDANQQKIFGDGTQATYPLNAVCSGNCNYVLYNYTFGSKIMAGSYRDTLVLLINY